MIARSSLCSAACCNIRVSLPFAPLVDSKPHGLAEALAPAPMMLHDLLIDAHVCSCPVAVPPGHGRICKRASGGGVMWEVAEGILGTGFRFSCVGAHKSTMAAMMPAV